MEYDTKDFQKTIIRGWRTYHDALLSTISKLDSEQLEARLKPELRSVGEITVHIIGARARWFYQVMGEGGDLFKSLGRWDRRGAKLRTPEELVDGLRATWDGIETSVTSWTQEDWQDTWPGEYEGEPDLITRQWIIWHLIEHDVHHGGEISIILGANGLTGIPL